MQRYDRIPPSLRREKESGFTLIELAMVLVIIGLFVGGVLVGKDLIRASEIRAISKEAEQFSQAKNIFQEKFNCVAGDCPNSTNFLSATGFTVQNGNGNGIIDNPLPYLCPEEYGFWQQLELAGLIPPPSESVAAIPSHGHYTGTYAPSSNWYAAPNYNIPKSISGGGWLIDSSFNNGCSYLNLRLISRRSGHWFVNGGLGTGGAGFQVVSSNYPSLTAADAATIDNKFDDGLPSTGRITTANTTYLPNCTVSNTSYNITSSGVVCNVAFFAGF